MTIAKRSSWRDIPLLASEGGPRPLILVKRGGSQVVLRAAIDPQWVDDDNIDGASSAG